MYVRRKQLSTHQDAMAANSFHPHGTRQEKSVAGRISLEMSRSSKDFNAVWHHLWDVGSVIVHLIYQFLLRLRDAHVGSKKCLLFVGSRYECSSSKKSVRHFTKSESTYLRSDTEEGEMKAI